MRRTSLCGFVVAVTLSVILSPISTTGQSQASGIIVEDILPNSPGARAGLKVGDLLMTYDGRPLVSVATLRALQVEAGAKKEIRLGIQRDGQIIWITVPVGTLGILPRPALSDALLKFYVEGKKAQEAEKIDEAITTWAVGAKAAEAAGNKSAAAWFSYLIGGAYAAKEQWRESAERFLAITQFLETNSDPAGLGQAFSSLALSSLRLNDTSAAIRWYERASETVTKADFRVLGAALLSAAGDIAKDLRDFKTARTYYERTLSVHERLLPNTHEHSESLLNVGSAAFVLNDYKTAESCLAKNVALLEKLAPKSIDLAGSLDLLGKSVMKRDVNAAEGYFVRGWAIRKELAPDSLQEAFSLVSLGDVAHAQSDFQKAESFYSQALKIRERLAPNSLLVAYCFEAFERLAESRRDFEAARDYQSRVLTIFERLIPNSPDLAESLTIMAIVVHTLGDYATAQTYYARAIAIYEVISPDPEFIASKLNIMGEVAVTHGDVDTARQSFERAYTILERIKPHSSEFARTLLGLSTLADENGDFDTAQALAERALSIRRAISPKSSDFAAVLVSLGNVADSRGNFQTAETYYLEARSIIERLEPNSLNLATVLKNLSNLADSRGDFQAAETYGTNALEIFKKLAPNSLAVAGALNQLGNVADSRGDTKAAQKYYEDALAIFERLAPDSSELSSCLDNLGQLLLGKNDLVAAKSYLTRALEIRERKAPNSLNLSTLLINLGGIPFREGDLKLARKYNERALEISKRLAPGSLLHATSHTSLGMIALAEGRSTDALIEYSEAANIVEAQRSKMPSLERRALLFARSRAPFEGLIETHIALGDLPAAFSVLERARARSLVEIFSERDLDFRSKVPANLLRQQRDLNEKRSATYSSLIRLGSKPDAKRLEVLQKELNANSVKQSELEERIRHLSPKLAQLKYPQPLDLKAAQGVLDPDTLLLAYWIKGNETLLFALTKTDIQMFRVSNDEITLSRQVRLFRDKVAVYRIDNDDPTRINELIDTSKQLYDTLVRPAQHLVNQAKRILICPEGSLNALPFSALVSQSGPQLRYFMEDKPLHTIPSLTVYAEIRKQYVRKERSRNRLLAFGDPHYGKSRGRDLEPLNAQTQNNVTDRDLAYIRSRGITLDPLPWSLSEVKRIGRIFGPTASTKVGKAATEKTAKLRSKDFSILHFAVHGWLDDQIGLNSGLAFSQPQALGLNATSGDNGLWQAWEIVEQGKLDSELVVLSACETALGQEIRGEGIIGLTRAFQYAGARSVVVSLWQVNDESTAFLMEAFYRELAKGVSKDVALQSAMVSLRHSRQWSHPFFWSPFVLVGDWKPIAKINLR
jgi:CHAT domain-containing protein/Tfp pilus assembly protein PilF